MASRERRRFSVYLKAICAVRVPDDTLHRLPIEPQLQPARRKGVA
jgi:hypothetical protein